MADIARTNIAAIRNANTKISALPNTGNSCATMSSTGPSANSTLNASTDPAAADANNIATYNVPATSWTLDISTLTRRAAPWTHIRIATTNQMNAMPANGIRYNPTTTTRRRLELS